MDKYVKSGVKQLEKMLWKNARIKEEKILRQEIFIPPDLTYQGENLCWRKSQLSKMNLKLTTKKLLKALSNQFLAEG